MCKTKHHHGARIRAHDCLVPNRCNGKQNMALGRSVEILGSEYSYKKPRYRREDTSIRHTTGPVKATMIVNMCLFYSAMKCYNNCSQLRSLTLLAKH